MSDAVARHRPRPMVTVVRRRPRRTAGPASRGEALRQVRRTVAGRPVHVTQDETGIAELYEE